eukprot:TRINITY_DN27101_c0_g1_i1.p1 TRINITY_DN27101_c0_g1~~TRINITY_DN27101_c0_g1_i1.p1  ORF type:complete len:269 (-),score=41.89 TRINITY_DN27101_c0_g1_i1:456-1262(-)
MGACVGKQGTLVKKTPPEKSEDAEAEEEENDEFQLTLHKRLDSVIRPLGLEVLEDEDDTLLIETVNTEGMVASFLRSNPEELDVHIREGYSILAVNNVSGDTEAMKLEMEAPVVTLKVRRTSTSSRISVSSSLSFWSGSRALDSRNSSKASCAPFNGSRSAELRAWQALSCASECTTSTAATSGLQGKKTVPTSSLSEASTEPYTPFSPYPGKLPLEGSDGVLFAPWRSDNEDHPVVSPRAPTISKAVMAVRSDKPCTAHLEEAAKEV